MSKKIGAGRPSRKEINAEKRVSVRVTPNEMEIIEAAAQILGKKKSDFVRAILLNYSNQILNEKAQLSV